MRSTAQSGAARLAGGPPAALCAGGQGHRAAVATVGVERAGGPAGRPCPTGVLAAAECRAGRQGPPLVRVGSPAAQHHRRAVRVAALAAGPPQPAHRGAGLLPVRRPGRPAAGRPGPGRGGSLAGGGGVPGQQGAVRPGPAPGPPLGLLVPVVTLAMLAYAFLVWPRPPNTPATPTVGAHPADLQPGPAPVRHPGRRPDGGSRPPVALVVVAAAPASPRSCLPLPPASHPAARSRSTVRVLGALVPLAGGDQHRQWPAPTITSQ